MIEKSHHVANPDDTLQLAAAYRHAFMNQLQVILGYIQLEQPARAAAYIALLRDSLFGETRLVRAAAGEAAAMLLLKRGVAESCGVEIQFDAAAGVAAFDWGRPEVEELAGALADGALFLLGRSGKGQRLEVMLQEEAGHRGMVFRLHGYPGGERLLHDLGAVLAAQGRPFDLHAAIRRLRAAGGRCEPCQAGEDAAVVYLSWPKGE